MDSINEYQQYITKFAIYPKEHELAYLTLGLCSEAGEVADKVKKAIRDNNGDIDAAKTQAIVSELGDVIWYVARLASHFGYTMDAVTLGNLNKLESRLDRNQITGSGDER